MHQPRRPATARRPLMCRRKEVAMRLDVIHLVAVAAIVISGCSANRGSGSGFSALKSGDRANTSVDDSYDVDPPTQNRPRRMAKEPPMVPPAIGVSRVKRVGFITVITDRLPFAKKRQQVDCCIDDPCFDDCVTEPCVTSEPPACGEESPCGEACRTASGWQRLNPAAWLRNSFQSLPRFSLGKRNCADGPGCGDEIVACGEQNGASRPHALQGRTVQPSYQDRIADPFVDDVPDSGPPQVPNLLKSSPPRERLPEPTPPAAPQLPDPAEPEQQEPEQPQLFQDSVRYMPGQSQQIPYAHSGQLPVITSRTGPSSSAADVAVPVIRSAREASPVEPPVWPRLQQSRQTTPIGWSRRN